MQLHLSATLDRLATKGEKTQSPMRGCVPPRPPGPLKELPHKHYRQDEWLEQGLFGNTYYSTRYAF